MAFYVDHGMLMAFNDTLRDAAGRIESKLGELDTALKNIPEAAQGQAVPLWQAAMANWDMLARQMHEDFASTVLASTNMGDIYLSGDNNTVRVWS